MVMLAVCIYAQILFEPKFLRTTGKFACHTHNDVVNISAQHVSLMIERFSRAHTFIYNRFTAEFSNIL